MTSSGRGGAGNMRSPSRDPAQPAETPAEYGVIAAATERDAELPHSSGRGGFGNILNKSRSRSRGPTEVMHSSGRGGVGNIVHGDEAILEQEERKAHRHPEPMCVKRLHLRCSLLIRSICNLVTLLVAAG